MLDYLPLGEIKTALWAPIKTKHRAIISSFIFKAIFIFIDHLNGRKSVPVRRKTWVLHLMKMETFGRYSAIHSEMETQQGLALFTCHPELLD